MLKLDKQKGGKMIEIEKFCPMMFVWEISESAPSNIECYGKKCAWWNKEKKECAILTQAKKLNYM